MRLGIHTTRFCLAVLVALPSCKEEQGGPPTCTDAMHNVYAQGCTYVDGDGNPIDVSQAISSCEGWRYQAETWGCMTAFDSMVDCLATMGYLDCHACEAISSALAECLLDAQDDPCPGYSGTDTACCYTTDPCGWAEDGYCDCDETCAWDTVDCENAALCADCITTSCSAEVDACNANMECTMLVQCLEDCPSSDEACANACAASYAGGIEDLNAVETCIATNCAEWCV